MMMLDGLVGRTASGEVLRVREVWQDNLEAEMNLIESFVEEYPYLAMDTEFPGMPRLRAAVHKPGTLCPCCVQRDEDWHASENMLPCL
jgi:hypothetical protein